MTLSLIAGVDSVAEAKRYEDMGVDVYTERPYELKLLEDDLFWIQQDLNNHLPPGATVNVVVTVLPFMTQYDITMSWSEAGFATPQTYSLTMQI